MNLPIINKPGYEVGYHDDDFVRNNYTVKKTFVIGVITYIMYYRTFDATLTVIKRTTGYQCSIKITREFLVNTPIKFVVRSILDLEPLPD